MTWCLRAKYNVEVIGKTCGRSAYNAMPYSCNHVLLWTLDMQEMQRMQSRCRESLRCVLGSRCREVGGGEEEGFLDLAERLTRGPKACTFRKVSRVKRPVKRALR